jgi:hypothetical protein
MISAQDVCCARLPGGSLTALAGLRAEADLRVVSDDNHAWVQWEPDNDRVRSRVFAVAGAELYGCRDGLWYRLGRHLPAFDLSVRCESRPLHQVLTPAQVEPVLPEVVRAAKVKLELVADDRPRPTTAMRCDLVAVAAWADLAPTARLEQIDGARSGKHVLLLARALPPIWGERFWGANVLVPLGHRPEPDLPESALLEAVGADRQELALLTAAGVEVVPRAAFQPLTRAGVRLAARGEG